MTSTRRRISCGGALIAFLSVLVGAASGWAQPAPVAITTIPHGRFPTNHGAALAKLRSGGLLACWYSGLTERGREAVILCSRAGMAGRNWSEAVVAVAAGESADGAAAANKSVGNVVLRTGAGDDLVMIYGVVQSRPVLGLETCTGWPCGRIDYKVSRDGGHTWNGGRRLDDRPGALPRSRPIRVAPGVDMLPVYREGGASSILSTDFDQAPTDRLVAKLATIPARAGLIQPALARAGSGKLFAYLRDQKREAVFVSAYDPAAGVWSRAAKTDLSNPGSALDALTDAHGRIVLVHNASARARRDLSISISDDGTTFPETCLFVAPPVDGEIAYPTIAELGPKLWGVVFSYGTKTEIGFAILTQDFIDACRPRSSRTSTSTIPKISVNDGD